VRVDGTAGTLGAPGNPNGGAAKGHGGGGGGVVAFFIIIILAGGGGWVYYNWFRNAGANPMMKSHQLQDNPGSAGHNVVNVMSQRGRAAPPKPSNVLVTKEARLELAEAI